MTFATRSFDHHSPHSDFNRIIDEVAALVPTRVVSPKPIPRVLGPARQRLARPRANLHYDERFLSQELQLAGPLMRSRKDVAHVLFLEDGGLRHLLRIRRPARRGLLVGTAHQPRSRTERQGELPWLRYALDRLDLVIALCERQADELRELARDGTHVAVVPGGVDPEWWCPAPEDSTDTGRRSVLSVGAHLRSKELLIGVADALEREAPDAQLELVLGDWGWRPELWRDSVHWNDRLTDEQLRERYRHASVVVHAVNDATFNNALVEALACGKAIVAPRVGGIEEYVGDAAELTPPGDTEAFAAAVTRLLHDDARREHLEQAARARALEIAAFPRGAALVAAYEQAADSRLGDRSTKAPATPQPECETTVPYSRVDG